jgi:hypothetical protein
MSTIPCSVCGALISKSNMSRHLKRDHPDHTDSLVNKFPYRKTNDRDVPTTASSSSSKEVPIATQATVSLVTASTVASTGVKSTPISSTVIRDSLSTPQSSLSAPESTFGAALLVKNSPPLTKKKSVNKTLSLESSSPVTTRASNPDMVTTTLTAAG